MGVGDNRIGKKQTKAKLKERLEFCGEVYDLHRNASIKHGRGMGDRDIARSLKAIEDAAQNFREALGGDEGLPPAVKLSLQPLTRELNDEDREFRPKLQQAKNLADLIARKAAFAHARVDKRRLKGRGGAHNWGQVPLNLLIAHLTRIAQISL